MDCTACWDMLIVIKTCHSPEWSNDAKTKMQMYLGNRLLSLFLAVHWASQSRLINNSDLGFNHEIVGR